MVLPDQASNLALIINELTTNSIKYALKNRDEGPHHRQPPNTAATWLGLFSRMTGQAFLPDVLARKTPPQCWLSSDSKSGRRSLKGNLICKTKNGQRGHRLLEFPSGARIRVEMRPQPT
jgi:hypothetical protein